MSVFTIVALLLFLTIPEGISQRCRCIVNEKRPIGRFIEGVRVNPASSHCSTMEIVATLKKDKTLVCLDPNMPWVKRLLQNAGVEQVR